MVNGYNLSVRVYLKREKRMESISILREGKFRTYKEAYADAGEFLFIMNGEVTTKDFFKVLSCGSSLLFDYSEGGRCVKFKVFEYETEMFKMELKIECIG